MRTGIKRDENGIETRRCLVGAQRLTAIHRFMLGTIPCEYVHRDVPTDRMIYLLSTTWGR